jgi:hypothetical protein
MAEEAAKASADVIELSALSSNELPALVEYLAHRPSLPFAHVLVHGPAKGLTRDVENELPARIAELPHLVEGVVLHPETLHDARALEVVDDRILLENMDPRKNDARTPEELSRFFSILPDAGFCLDVAHAWLHDPSMRLAHDLVDAFGDRLAEVHVSSILPSGTHIALEWHDLMTFESVLKRCVGVPWVLEASAES